jgi:N-dimethylarginine dimethylaminohydrolase
MAGAFGGQSMTAPLRRVLVRPPRRGDLALWREYGWRSEPDPAGIEREHEAFRAILAAAGVEVVVAEAPLAPDPDSIYVFDPAIVTDRGAILLRPGKDGRQVEAGAMEVDLERACVPVLARLEAPATAEGGDTVWLDERTLLVGWSYRTNGAGVEQLAAALPDIEVIAFDLPHLNGRSEVLHLMSLISPLDVDLALAFLPLLPARLVELLEERGVGLVEVPESEFESMGPNVLAPARGVPSRSRGTTRHGAAWRPWASRCSSTRATSSRARATAARPV